MLYFFMLSESTQCFPSYEMNDDPVNIYESLCETVDEAQSEPSSREVGALDMVRCPFYEPVRENQRSQSARFVKRAQRHRSTAQSRLGDMTVGDIRYCFQQLRNAGKNLRPEMMLYNGQSAGEFALKYLRETSTAMRKRRKKLSMAVRDSVEDAEAKEGIAKRQLVRGDRLGVLETGIRRDQHNLNVLEF